MLPFLVLVPLGTSLVLGIVYVMSWDTRPASKIVVGAVFVAAVYLQFFTRHSLIGLLLQVVLALYLAMWQKLKIY